MLAGNKLLRARVRVSSIRSNRTGNHECSARNSPENEMFNRKSFREWFHCVYVLYARNNSIRATSAEHTECFHRKCANNVNNELGAVFPHGPLRCVCMCVCLPFVHTSICVRVDAKRKGKRTVQVHARMPMKTTFASNSNTSPFAVRTQGDADVSTFPSTHCCVVRNRTNQNSHRLRCLAHPVRRVG